MNINLSIQEDDDKGIDFENYSLEEEIKKYEGFEPVNFHITLRMYVEPVEIQTKGGILLTGTRITKDHDDKKFRNRVGLVVQFGKGVYEDETRYDLCGPLCKIGDWILIPRAEGHSTFYDNMTTLIIREDRV